MAAVELRLDRDVLEAAVAARRCEARRVVGPSSSEGVDDEVWDEGGEEDDESNPPYTLAQGARVRKVGFLSGCASPPALTGSSCCRRGSVSAQFSHAAARRVT